MRYIIREEYFLNSTSVPEIVRLALQFATLNGRGYYPKLDLVIKFHTEVATHLLHIKLRTLYTLNIIL